MSDRGWVGFNVNYRLSPGATFPDHLVDIKRAIAWIRGHADAYGVDARFIAVTGGSAGGHLAAMTALTGGDPAFQPGFEDADTRVQAAVPFYGLYDLTDQSKTHARGFMSMLLEPIVLKAFYEDEPDKFRAASPVDQIHPDAPPFFVIHGDRDTMAPLADARVFVEKLRAISRAPVVYAEIRGAQHAFDLLVSPRSLSVIEGVGDWLDFLYHEGAHPIASSTAGPDLESPATARL
jgi:acetyl esterase/lipase